ncbi:MAG: hypothetical protein HKN58_10075 [Xanthomonadales bacterium]|nr:hypothetical protein [Xanthomonadales bacterium]
MNARAAMTLFAVTTLALLSAPGAWAKGGEDKPTHVLIDPAGNDVDVVTMPALKIDGSQNEVDANITNEVEIKNDSGGALRVDTGAATRIPYAVMKSAFGSDHVIIENFNVPEGYVFVIEYVNTHMRCTSGCDGISSARITLETGGAPFEAFLPVQAFASSASGTENFLISESLRLYADPENTVSILLFAEPDTARLTGGVGVSGYLLPVDEAVLSP